MKGDENAINRFIQTINRFTRVSRIACSITVAPAPTERKREREREVGKAITDRKQIKTQIFNLQSLPKYQNTWKYNQNTLSGC